MRWIAAVVIAAALSSAAIANEAEFPDVANTSFREPNGDRTLQISIRIAAPPGRVFEAFASPEGWQRWAAPSVTGEARVGGVLETSYDPAAKPGDAQNIKNRIVAWLPERLVVLTNIKAPADFENPELFQQTATIIELAPDGPEGTRVTLSGVGFGPGPEFDGLYAGFTWGNSYSLENLKRAVETGPIDWVAEMRKTARP